ncbi:acyl-ACP thioesterase [Longilinea arvoryzae]|uniref:Acyl-ACP thioesterase n=1 Tax=Longilinea arvoryzae TaxID=360412 RepID=A0A0S7BCJ7_9CHLR|nr:acyl-ACP thioesterase domain-containing protein [Longilinea arvoryzae]GAP12480.1 acyl-ACP thioesterase [Longilinea arvoryzae]
MIDSKPIYEETIRVNNYECDFNQTLKPAAFFQHLTEAAGIHATQLGAGFDVLYAQNLFWVHSRMKIQFYRFPRVDDRVTIRTWPKTIQQKLFFIRDYEMFDAQGQRVAAATSAWLIINATTRRMIPPQSLNLNLPTHDRIGLDEPLERIGLAKDGQERLCVRAAYSAVDMLGHVNNSRYVEWICDAFPMETFKQHKLDWLQINYDHEIRPGEEVAVLANPTERDANLWALEGVNRSNDTRAFESAVHWQD